MNVPLLAIQQGDVAEAEIARVVDERAAHAAAAGTELADAPGNNVYEHVRVADFSEGLLGQFRIHAVFERAKVTGHRLNATENFRAFSLVVTARPQPLSAVAP